MVIIAAVVIILVTVLEKSCLKQKFNEESKEEKV